MDDAVTCFKYDTYKYIFFIMCILTFVSNSIVVKARLAKEYKKIDLCLYAESSLETFIYYTNIYHFE